MTSILPFDELNAFRLDIESRFGKQKLREVITKEEEEDIIDELLDLFLLSYSRANEVTNANLSSDWMPKVDVVMETVDKEVAGETWRERVNNWFENGTGDDIVRIAETESHRIANQAALDTAYKAGATRKTWVTMLDERVRFDHDLLEGVTVDIDEDFYAMDGSHAPAPGMFGVPEQDVNCRCELLFS